MRRALGYAFSRTIPVMCGYLFLGAAYGLLMQQAGYGWGWSALTSLVVYAGSMQFVLAGMLSSGGGLAAAAVTALLVNGRHIFYGLSFIQRFREQGRVRGAYMVSSLTDETYSLLVTGHPQDVDSRLADFLIALLDQFYWVAGSALGGMLGQAVAFDLTGIDFSMTALFVVILVEQVRARENRWGALMGFLVASAALLLLGQDRFLLPAMGLIVALTVVSPWKGGAKV